MGVDVDAPPPPLSPLCDGWSLLMVCTGCGRAWWPSPGGLCGRCPASVAAGMDDLPFLPPPEPKPRHLRGGLDRGNENRRGR